MSTAFNGTELTLGDKTFTLHYDFGALRKAKALLVKEGIQINMMKAFNFDSIDIDTLPALLFAALVTNHPLISYTQAADLFSMGNAALIYQKLADAYIAAVRAPELTAKRK